jgi:hypothetical protein
MAMAQTVIVAPGFLVAVARLLRLTFAWKA